MNAEEGLLTNISNSVGVLTVLLDLHCFVDAIYAYCHFYKRSGMSVRGPLQPVAMSDGSVGNELGAVRCSFDDDIVDHQSIPWKRLAVGLQIYFREVDTTVKMDIQGQINNIQARLQNAMDEMVDKVRANRTIANETS